LSNLGGAAQHRGNLDEAVQWYRRALALQPDFAAGWSNLGAAYTELGEPRQAADCQARAIQIEPLFAHAYSNMLFALSYLDDVSAEALFEKHKQFGERFAQPARSHSNNRDTDRVIRVGYLSAD